MLGNQTLYLWNSIIRQKHPEVEKIKEGCLLIVPMMNYQIHTIKIPETVLILVCSKIVFNFPFDFMLHIFLLINSPPLN